MIIGDLSTKLIALEAPCCATGQKVIYWQDSNRDFKQLPVKADHAVILNGTGPELARLGPGDIGADNILAPAP